MSYISSGDLLICKQTTESQDFNVFYPLEILDESNVRRMIQMTLSQFSNEPVVCLQVIDKNWIKVLRPSSGVCLAFQSKFDVLQKCKP